ncbi:MAG: alpha-glucan family phosphorylase [Bacteroidales bacterium]|nr:alpha-glucan family phosphorylase [Bacteroidales bacterium]
MKSPDFIFEVSWEVCNKVGGIHTVVSTKAKSLCKKFASNYILIGPDICKDETVVQEFEQEEHMLPYWVEYARNKGLKFRIGRWKSLEDQPTVILVDFTQYFNRKDEIFAELWADYSLDSITGGWDYIEPCLFGYAAAKIIESYYEFYLDASNTAVAQFHEWMTGSGVLYLKKRCPQIATAFTTHATVLGRALAGNRMPLYGELENYNPDSIASQFNLRAKQSLEKLSAQNSDVFTVVSGITDTECARFFAKKADFITPNGFENSMVPDEKTQSEIRKRVREKILSTLAVLSGVKLSEDALFVLNSGRYEFYNKGIDVFIDALGKLNRENNEKEIVAVIAVPAHHISPVLNAEKQNKETIYQNQDSLERNQDLIFQNQDSDSYLKYTTHRLFDNGNDSVVKRLKECGLDNSESSKVKVLFVPSYLNGADGVFDEKYFDFLQAFDLTVFPSYYEPWGYTPMESIAFGVPTLTTTLAGFGLWMQDKVSKDGKTVRIVSRTDFDYENCVAEIAEYIKEYSETSVEERKTIKQQCKILSDTVVWERLVENYYKAYDFALNKAAQRQEMFKHKQAVFECCGNIQPQSFNTAHWRKVFFRQQLPKRLAGLEKLSQNLWWSWNKEAYELFESIDAEKFALCNHNPLPLLESLSLDDVDRLLRDEVFLAKMDKVEKDFDAYMQKQVFSNDEMIAYFSMEYGIDDCLKIFSGGLGILAGDYLKQASDSAKNIIGIGLLYRYGYFTQRITHQGEQQCEYNAQKFSHLPLKAVRNEKGEWCKVSLTLPGRNLEAKIWRIDVGRVSLYLLDTDVESNSEEDRFISSRLYGGDSENRLKQEILLGMGGVKLIKELSLPVSLYHNNEGHAAFSSLERMKQYLQTQKYTYAQAKELVRATTLFTTHTPVAAGHDMFEEGLLRAYMGYFAERLTISWQEFMNLGRMDENDGTKFSMSVLAMNFSAQVNAVSLIHRDVSRKMFAPLYKGYFPDELYIDYVTNGVHNLTWTSQSWQKLYRDTFSEDYLADVSNQNYWNKIKSVDNSVLWQLHKKEKESLVEFIKSRLQKEYTLRAENPQVYFETIKKFDSEKLTVGFARRFATYKRADLLFSNLDKLKEIVDKGVQFVFAGKAHPQDKAGADLIRRIIEVSRMPQFLGSIIFIENYDMSVAKRLVSGVDLWLNLPTRPLEASGTSGEKAVMNGVVNFSVLDGWWAEGYREDAGWALPKEVINPSNDYQNAFDAQMLYDIFLSEIIPAYYQRNQNDVSDIWCEKMKNTIADIAPHYTMKRQLDDYYDKFYSKMLIRKQLLETADASIAKDYALWKENVSRFWSSVQPIEFKYPHSEREALSVRDEFSLEVVLYIAELKASEVGVELIMANKENEQVMTYSEIIPFELIESGNKKARYRVLIKAPVAGVHDYAIRIYPHCELTPHRQDFPLVKWI